MTIQNDCIVSKCSLKPDLVDIQHVNWKLINYYYFFLLIADIDDCLNNTCSGNGDCSDRVNGFYCYCYDGFYGINCEISKHQEKSTQY